MSLEQYKNKNRGELWDVVVIQAEVIAELEKALSTVVSGLFSENELVIRDLEQQAKGLTDYAKEQEQGLNAVWMIAAASKLRNQAKELQEQCDE